MEDRALIRAGASLAAVSGLVAAWYGAGALGSTVVGFGVLVAEYLSLDAVAAIQGERTRRRLLELVGLLNRWCSVREDLLYAFERSLGSGLGEPMKGHVRDLVTRIRGGMAVERSLELFGEVADHPQFREFVTSVRFNLRYRGDLSRFLEGTESQLGRIEEEYNRRRISTARDRTVVLGVLVAVPPVAFAMISAEGPTRTLFLETGIGGIAAYLAAGLYLSGAYLLLSASGARG
jgi:Flp pilus assembly protein TadB